MNWNIFARSFCALLITATVFFYIDTARAQGTPGTCDDSVPLVEAERGAENISDTPTLIREEPTTTADVQAEIPVGGRFRVLGEPVCSEGWTWYPVAFNLIENEGDFMPTDNVNITFGWTVGGAQDGSEDWIAPLAVDAQDWVGYLPQPETLLDGIANARPTVGDQARVQGSPTRTVPLRAEPDTSAGVLVEMTEGTVLDILDGPVESDQVQWWQARTPQGTVGWVAEFSYVGTPWFDIPNLIPRCPFTGEGRIAAQQDATVTRQPFSPLPVALITSAPDGSDVCHLHYVNGNTGYNIFAWSPDGSELAFIPVENILGGVGGAFVGDSRLYTVSADGLTLTQVAPANQFYESPVYSPDGTQIAYILDVWTIEPRIVQLWLVDADGSNRRLVEPELTVNGFYADLHWLGNEIYLAGDEELFIYNTQTGDYAPAGFSNPRFYPIIGGEGVVMYDTETRAYYEITPQNEIVPYDLPIPPNYTLVQINADNTYIIRTLTRVYIDGIHQDNLANYWFYDPQTGVAAEIQDYNPFSFTQQ